MLVTETCKHLSLLRTQEGVSPRINETPSHSKLSSEGGGDHVSKAST